MAEAAVDSGLHLQLGTTNEEEEEEEEEEEDQETLSSLHRIQSESTITHHQEDEGELLKHESYPCLPRSKSDAILLHNATDSEEEFPDMLTMADQSRNVSECNRVYLDLSRAEPFERVEFSESTVTMFMSTSGRQLETIPQDEELKTMDLSHLYASQRSLNNCGSSHSSLEDVSVGQKSRSCSSSSSVSCQEVLRTTASLKASLQAYSYSLKAKVRTLQMGSIPEQVNALEEINVLIDQAWTTPVYGRDLAYGLCDILRTDRALDIVLGNLNSTNRDLMKASARLLNQSLTTPNRNYVAECGLESVVKMTRDHQGDVELAVSSTGILESLFKTSELSCSRVIQLGGLQVIVFWCRSRDPLILRHCAIALSNLALYGESDNQQEMIAHKAPEWLFPLAFVDDEVTRYYACLALAVLSSNKEIEASVVQSGTLDLVPPFLRAHDPRHFAHQDPSHTQGRSPDWLRRLAPVLRSSRQEARALAAFHMVMEASIKAEQDRKEVLYDTGVVDNLKWLASTPRSLATRLAAQALCILGEEVPHKLSHQVPLWTVDDVLQWITQVGFADYADGFRSCQVDGDLLLRMTETELQENIAMPCAITRKRFMRELKELKTAADYSSCDQSRIGDWLAEVGSEFMQYTYQMLQAGVDKRTLMLLTDGLLMNECAIANGIHRSIILGKVEEHRVRGSRPGSAHSGDSVNYDVSGRRSGQPIDVFLSYRRSNGSQLASLLKVHLQLRGFSVFIDIERLLAGKFDESLLHSVRQASHMVVVLSPGALDRCMGDDQRDDWVHKEIATALESGVNIIPLTEDGFHWPLVDSLPADIRQLPSFNRVRWIHDYQDACVDKLENFIRGEHHHHHSPSPQTCPLSPYGADRGGHATTNVAAAVGGDGDGDEEDAGRWRGDAGSPLGSCVDKGGEGRRVNGGWGCSDALKDDDGDDDVDDVAHHSS